MYVECLEYAVHMCNMTRKPGFSIHNLFCIDLKSMITEGLLKCPPTVFQATKLTRAELSFSTGRKVYSYMVITVPLPCALRMLTRGGIVEANSLFHQ